MARTRMPEATLLGLFFCVPLGYTLLARFLHRDTDELPVDVNKELRFGKALQPIVYLLVRQGGETLAVRRGTADEKRARDNIVDLPLLIPQGTVCLLYTSDAADE